MLRTERGRDSFYQHSSKDLLLDQGLEKFGSQVASPTLCSMGMSLSSSLGTVLLSLPAAESLTSH